MNPDPVFADRLTELQQQCAANAQAALTGEQRRWMQPAAREAWQGNPWAPATIADAFDRSGPNASAASALHQSGSMGELMGAKAQIDYLAIMERAFRMRHLTPARAAMHAAVRLAGHGRPAGIHIGGALQYVQDLLTSGQKSQT